MTGSSAKEQVRDALGGVWDRAYPVILERIETIERATAELSKYQPRAESIAGGRTEAHRLAGALGTFGLDRGTELAREVEWHLDAPGTAEDAADLARLVLELRTVIERARVG